LDFKGDAIKKLRDHKDMLQDVSLLQERVNGLSGRLRRFPRAGAKMTIPGMAAGHLHRTAGTAAMTAAACLPRL
jgi:hypothetical protein